MKKNLYFVNATSKDKDGMLCQNYSCIIPIDGTPLLPEIQKTILNRLKTIDSRSASVFICFLSKLT